MLNYRSKRPPAGRGGAKPTDAQQQKAKMPAAGATQALRLFCKTLVSINLNNEIMGRRKDKNIRDQPLKKEMPRLKTE
jgi:hypothetical protein